MASHTKEILVIQTAFLGDLLLSIPLLKNLRDLEPEARISVLCRKGFGDFLLTLNLCSTVIEYDKTLVKDFERVRKEVLGKAYDVVLSVHRSPRTALLVSQIKAKDKIGFSDWYNFFAYNKRVSYQENLPDALRQLAVLTLLSPLFFEKYQNFVHQYTKHQSVHQLNDVEKNFVIQDWISMRVEIPEACLKLADSFLLSNKKKVIIAPGSVWATKRWLPERFADICRRYMNRGYEVILIGSGTELLICNQIQTEVPEVTNLCSQTSLLQLLSIMKRAEILLSNDSGAMHLATVAGLKVVAVFGPTTLNLGYRPWQTQALVVQKDLHCRPCGKHGHQKCPLGTHDCMKQIAAEDVFEAMKSLTSYNL